MRKIRSARVAIALPSGEFLDSKPVASTLITAEFDLQYPNLSVKAADVVKMV